MFRTGANTTYSLSILSTSTMNSVLKFENGVINLSVPNAIGSTLSPTLKITAGIKFNYCK